MMEIVLGKEGLDNTWQDDFPETAECRCGGEARIAFVGCEADQPKGSYVCNLHENGGRGDYWLHDAIAVAVYFCKDCFTAVTLWNQA